MAEAVTITHRRQGSISLCAEDGEEIKQQVQDKNAPAIVVDGYGQPFSPPDYSLSTILKAIPSRCYKRSANRGLSYVARDLFFIALLGLCAYKAIPLLPSKILRGFAWAIYSFCQGLFGTGIWVLAHECGHRAFSDSVLVCDIVGWTLHSALLVPYHSWRISHAKHHQQTGNLQKDMVFVPKTKQEYLENRGISEYVEETPIATLYYLILQQLFGWPWYLISNVTGQEYPNVSSWRINHFLPSSPLFDKRNTKDILLSDAGIAIAGTCCFFAIKYVGWANFILYYFLPYLWVNHWLVFITYLQHSDPSLPHYDNEEWTFTRGAAATIDRDFGIIGQHIFHDIMETHVLHHYISRIPFYNAREASQALQKVMGKHYKHDPTHPVRALWRACRYCNFVDGPGGIKMYRNVNNLGVGLGK